MAIVTVSGLEPNQEALLVLEAAIREQLAIRHSTAQATINNAVVLFPQDLLGGRETVAVTIVDLTTNQAHTREARRYIADTLAKLLVEYVGKHGPKRCKSVVAHVDLTATAMSRTLPVIQSDH